MGRGCVRRGVYTTEKYIRRIFRTVSRRPLTCIPACRLRSSNNSNSNPCHDCCRSHRRDSNILQTTRNKNKDRSSDRGRGRNKNRGRDDKDRVRYREGHTMTTNKYIVSVLLGSNVCKKDRFVLKNEYVTEERGERVEGDLYT